MSRVCDETVGTVCVVTAAWLYLRVNRLGVIVRAEEDVLEDEDARLFVLMGDDNRDDTEGGKGDERADAYASNKDEEGV